MPVQPVVPATLQPERITGTRCDTMVGAGMVSYHCTLAQGHPEEEPHYAIESGRAVRAWQAWKAKQITAERLAEQAALDAEMAQGDPSTERTQDDVNADHMRDAGLKPELLGAPVESLTGPDPDRCESRFDAHIGHGDRRVLRCAGKTGHQTRHFNGRIRWDDTEQMYDGPVESPEGDETEDGSAYDESQHIPEGGPTRAPGRRTGDQPLPDGDGNLPSDQVALVSDLEAIISLVKAREVLGIERYGQGHRPFNGRRTIQDALDEAIDMSVYLRSLIRARDMERDGLVTAAGQVLDEIIGHALDSATRKETVDLMAGAVVDRLLDALIVNRDAS